MRQTEPTRAAMYLRVSTDTQVENGASLPMQEERLRAYCIARGWEAAELYRDEGFSGTDLARPEMVRLLEDAKARRFDVVLCYSLSRITRNIRDLGNLLDLFRRKRIALASVSEGVDSTTASGELVLSVLTSVAAWEARETASRTSAVLRSKRARLEAYSGEILYGFHRVKDRLEPIAEELETVAQILDLRRQGMTLRAIAARLDAAGVPTKKGRRGWSPEVCRQIILREDFYRNHISGLADAPAPPVRDGEGQGSTHPSPE